MLPKTTLERVGAVVGTAVRTAVGIVVGTATTVATSVEVESRFVVINWQPKSIVTTMV